MTGPGEPQLFLPKSPYLALAQQWMKLDTLIYGMEKGPVRILWPERMVSISGLRDYYLNDRVVDRLENVPEFEFSNRNEN